MRTLGIDLAAQDKETAYCVILWENGQAEVIDPVANASDRMLLDEMRLADWIGIDAPFGWPDDFVGAVHGYTTTGAWPDETPSSRMRHRETDRVVHDVVADEADKSIWPLSVSSDRIAVCAWRCASLLSAHADENAWTFDRIGIPTDVDPAPGSVVAASGLVEVYPAAALALWGLTHKGYKGPADPQLKRDRRAEILDKLEQITAPWLSMSGEAREGCVLDDDRLDALIASLVARAAATGRSLPPDRAQLVPARSEGWIHLPAADAIFDLAVG